MTKSLITLISFLFLSTIAFSQQAMLVKEGGIDEDINEIKTILQNSDYLFFQTTTNNSWSTNGTSQKTKIIGEDVGGYSRIIYKDRLIFGTQSGSLWSSDGSLSGTFPIIHFPKSQYLTPSKFIILDDLLLFQCYSEEEDLQGCWKTDGTTEGTKFVSKKINNPRIVFMNEVYLSSLGSNGVLRKTDGTDEGTVVVKDFNISSSYPTGFYEYNNSLYFQMNDGIHGNEIWKTHGTEETTELVGDIVPGIQNSNAFCWITYNNQLIIGATNLSSKGELWKIKDGNLEKIIEISAGSLTLFKDQLFFPGHKDGFGSELWKTDGTENGTVQVKDINEGNDYSSPTSLTPLGNELLFAARTTQYGTELWKTDGTESGTVLVKDINPGTRSSSPKYFIRFQNEIYFVAYDVQHGHELWKTDGTAEGTILVADVKPGYASSKIRQLTVFKNELYFTALDENGDRDLWKLGDGNYCKDIFDITPDTLFKSRGETGQFNVDGSITINNAQWQADFGLGFQNLFDSPKFTGTQSHVALLINNIDFQDHELKLRFLGEDNNCRDTSKVGVVILKDTCFTTVYDSIVHHDTIFTTVADTLIVSFVVSVNGQNENQSIKIYPNPATDKLVVNISEPNKLEGYQATIADNQGAIVFDEIILHEPNYTIDVAQWPKGIYYFTLRSDHGDIISAHKILLK